MAHELDYNAETGEAAYFGVKTPAWHREGFTVDTPPETVMAALDLASADYEVEKRTLFVMDGDTPVEVPGHFATYRADRNQVLGTVKERYTVLQNRDAFAVLQPLVEDGTLTLETGGVLREGRDAWLLGKFSAEEIILKQTEKKAAASLDAYFSEVQPYALVSNNHSGDNGVLLMETDIRVVCANTMRMALAKGQQAKVVHSESVKQNVEFVAQSLWGRVTERYASFGPQYELLRKTTLQREQDFQRLVLDPVVPIRHLERKLAREDNKMTAAFLARAEGRRAIIRQAWDEGDGHVGDHSAWEALNAVTQTLDHHEDFGPREGGSRVQQMVLGGSSDVTKGRVLKNLLDFGARNGTAEDRELVAVLKL